ncbi:MAG: hypothetical protein ABI418_01515 [Jatrophihabitantaceae bacterium]
MTEADRRAQELAREQERRRLRDGEQRKASLARDRSELISEGTSLAHSALVRLAALDYPDMVSVPISLPRLGLSSARFGYRRTVKGAWILTTDRHDHYEDEIWLPTYLLSDGRFAHLGNLFALDAADATGGFDDTAHCSAVKLRTIVVGLQALTARLKP